MMNLKIGDIVKAKDCEIRLVVVGASDKGYDLFSVWPFNDRFIYWEVDADGHGDILSIVPDPEWDAMKVTNLQKKTERDGDSAFFDSVLLNRTLANLRGELLDGR